MRVRVLVGMCFHTAEDQNLLVSEEGVVAREKEDALRGGRPEQALASDRE